LDKSVVIHPTGQFKSFFNNQSEIIVEAGCTVRETLELMKIQPAVVAAVIVNGVLQSKDYTLQEEDDVKFFDILGGG